MLFKALYIYLLSCHLIWKTLLYPDQNEAKARVQHFTKMTYGCIWKNISSSQLIIVMIYLCPAVFATITCQNLWVFWGIFVCASATKCWCEVLTQPLLHRFQRPPLYHIQWLCCAPWSLAYTSGKPRLQTTWDIIESVPGPIDMLREKALHNWIAIEY